MWSGDGSQGRPTVKEAGTAHYQIADTLPFTVKERALKHQY
jgi:hypothetical protein